MAAEKVSEFRAVLMSVFVALIGAAFTIGVIYKTVTDSEETTSRAIETMKETMAARLTDLSNSFSQQLSLTTKLHEAQLALRDLKLDVAYESAKEGPRYTAAMAQAHDDLDDERYYDHDDRIGDMEYMCVETRKRIVTLENKHDIGYQPHTNGNGNEKHK